MYICAEYLKMPHIEFKKLPLSEQLKWLIYVEEEGKDRKRQNEKRDEQLRLQKMKAEAKKPGMNPGVHRKR
jgi:hypothetical protein